MLAAELARTKCAIPYDRCTLFVTTGERATTLLGLPRYRLDLEAERQW